MSNLAQNFRGSGGGTSGGSNSGSINEQADNLLNDQRLEIIDLLGGPCQGWVYPDQPLRNIILDGTPVQNSDGSLNFKNVEYSVVWGTADQALASGWDAAASETTVGVEVRADRDVVREIVDPRISSLIVTIGVTEFKHVHGSGDITGASVAFAIDLAVAGGEYRQIGLGAFDGVKTSSGGSRNYRIATPADMTGPYRVRVRRLTPDSSSSLLSNKIYWQSYTKMVERRFRYPFCTCVTLRVSARDFNAAPTREYLVQGAPMQIPANYTPAYKGADGVWQPAVYATTGPGTTGGAWNGTFKIGGGSNPAWALYYVLSDPMHGLGEYLPASSLAVTKWDLYQVAQYCDELVPDGLGGMEPRFTCDLQIKDRTDALKLITELAGVARIMSWYADAGIGVAQDRPSAPAKTFTNANVIEGAFAYPGASRSGRPTIAYVSYRNPENNYQPEVLPVSWAPGIARFGLRETEFLALGATSRGQAARAGMHALASAWLLSGGVNFKAGLDSIGIMPGDVIEIRDKHRSGRRLGGRLRSVPDLSTLVLDAPVSLDLAALNEITVAMPDGTRATRAIENPSPLPSATLTLAAPLPAQPVPWAVWSMRVGEDRADQWRVVSLQPAGLECEVAAVAYDPQVYELIDTVKLDATSPARIGPLRAAYRISAPARIKGLLSVVRLNSNTPSLRLTVSWPQAENAMSYSLRWRRAGDSWSVTAQSSAMSVDLDGVANGTYELEVSAFNVFGQVAKIAADYIVDDAALRAPPSAVTGFRATLEGFAVRLAWDEIPDADRWQYALRVGAEWATATPLATLASTSYLMPVQATGNTTVLIKALDQFGAESEAATACVVQVPAPTTSDLALNFSGAEYVLEWQFVPGLLALDHYEIRHGGANWEEATPIVSTYATRHQARAEWGGLRWFRIRAVDVAGNFGEERTLDAMIWPPFPIDVTAQVLDSNVQLRWRSPASFLPIDRVVITRTGGSPVTVAGDSLFAQITEQVGGTFTYGLTAYDTAGNTSLGSITVNVGQPQGYILRDSIDSDFSGALTSMVLSGGKLYAPQRTDAWQQRFTDNSWSTLGAQVAAGYPGVWQPSPATSRYEEAIDLGEIVPASGITLSLSSAVLSGSPVVSYEIAAKAASGDAWTVLGTDPSAFSGEGFRYLRVRVDVASTGGDDLLRIDALNIRIATRRRTDSGAFTALGADVGGTWVPFNTTDFLAANTPIVQINSSTQATAAVDFNEADPTGFHLYLFDRFGVRVSGAGSWSVEGV